jgi:hypothetical protein
MAEEPRTPPGHRPNHVQLRTLLALVALLTFVVWLVEMGRRSEHDRWKVVVHGQLGSFIRLEDLPPKIQRKKLYHLSMVELYDRASRSPWQYYVADSRGGAPAGAEAAKARTRDEVGTRVER